MEYRSEPMFLPLPRYGSPKVSELPAGARVQPDVKRAPEVGTLAMEARKQQVQQQSQQQQQQRSVDGRVECNATLSEGEVSKAEIGLTGAGGRWWMRSVVLCPLCNFPISFIPYPPFKLRVEPDNPKPHVLVDGKFLAMQVIANLDYVACNRTLVKSDIEALDEYIRRCKLGPFRPGQAFALAQEAALAVSQERRMKAQKDLDRLIAGARNQLGKLRRIQEGRMRQLNDGQETLTTVVAEAKPKASVCSDSSTFASSTASTSSVASFISDMELPQQFRVLSL